MYRPWYGQQQQFGARLIAHGWQQLRGSAGVEQHGCIHGRATGLVQVRARPAPLPAALAAGPVDTEKLTMTSYPPYSLLS